jgi:hypothetical protein
MFVLVFVESCWLKSVDIKQTTGSVEDTDSKKANLPKPDAGVSKEIEKPNGTAQFKQCKQLFEYQHLLLLRDIWWSKFESIFKCCSFFQHQS